MLSRFWGYIKKGFRCKLCWHITLIVFACIMVSEIIILVPSYRNFEHDQIGKLQAEALASLRTLLMAKNLGAISKKSGTHELYDLMRTTPIRGIRLNYTDGSRFIQAGEIPAHPKTLPQALTHWFDSSRIKGGTRIDVAFPPRLLLHEYSAVVRLDTTNLEYQLRAFIYRIMGLASFIAGFTTVATMFSLNLILLHPLLKLRQQMTQAREDPEHPQQYLLRLHRSDELGDLSALYNSLLIQIGDGLARITNHEKALEKANEDLEYRVKTRTYDLQLANDKLAKEISERQRYEQELIQLTNYDVVTELPNQQLFTTRLDQSIMDLNEKGEHIALFVLELNELQEISDAFGQHVRDKFLKRCADSLNNKQLYAHTHGRIGSNQLAIYTKIIHDVACCVDIAQHILEIYAKPFHIGDLSIATTLNIGIAIAPQNSTDAKRLLRNADLALQRGKRSLPNSYQFYESEMNKHIESRHTLLVDLHYALENNEFELYYQPKLHLASHRVIGMEALLRWQHPKQGLLSPGIFINTAEESGLIIQIGNWVLEEACQQAKRWQDMGLKDLRMGVNLSTIQFHQENIVQVVYDALEKTQLPSSCLELEITESVAITKAEHAIQTMHDLHSLGILLALDDFGTGYSSLSYLKRFPVHVIKIDQSFIRCISEQTPDTQVADSIVYLAHRLGLKVTAEGVETEHQAHYLAKTGCDEVQGYYYAKPLSAADFEAYLKQHQAQDPTTD